MNRHNDYLNASDGFMRKAYEYLEQGDLVQASEKGWGAAALMVKAVAEQRGWAHNGHAQLYQAVGSLMRETGDRQLLNLFHVAGSLHINFYENWHPVEMVTSGIQDVQLFVEKLRFISEQNQ